MFNSLGISVVCRYNVKQVHAKAQMEWLEVLVMGVLVERPGPVLTRVLQWLGSV